MSFDNLCKLLAERHPQCFVRWLLGEPSLKVEVLKTELSIEPIRADSVILLAASSGILHLEFQTQFASKLPLPLRMLDYSVRLYRIYRVPIAQVVVLLLPPANEDEIVSVFEVQRTRHEYRVVRLWDEDPEVFLAEPALLPLAVLCGRDGSTTLLERVAAQVQAVNPEDRALVSSYVQILAGLKYQKALIRQIFREDVMRESVIYQEILEEGRQEGWQEGRQEGERSLVLKQLMRRVGVLSEEARSQIFALSLEQLEALGVALLDFGTVAELEDWLRAMG